MKNLETKKFEKIGTYFLEEGEISQSYSVKKSERLSLVYALVCDGEVMYVGKTVQGYQRPLSYHKNDVMKSVQSGIYKACQNGKNIDVWARSEGLEISFEDLKLNIIEAYEQALILEFSPEWNNYSHK